MVFNGDDLYGTISLDKNTDFGKVDAGSSTQWITLFEDPEDDLYDGTLGEDDDEDPRINLTFKMVSVIKLDESKERHESTLQPQKFSEPHIGKNH